MLKHIAIAFMSLTLLAGCTLIGESIENSPAPDLPTVDFLFPPNGAQVIEGTDLTIEVLAQDANVGIERVMLFVDEDSSGEPLQVARPVDAATVPIFRVEMNWLAAGVGQHRLTTRAYRLDGTPSNEATIIVDVVARNSAGTQPPQAGSTTSPVTEAP